MEIVIKPKSTFSFNLRELWSYRELLYIFTWRDLKVRYKQTLLGITWVLFQPVVLTVIFSMFFGRLVKIPSGDLPYPLFVFIGLTYWTFFSNALTAASNSLIAYEGMIKKVYFPREIIPLSAILTAAFDLLITFLLLLVAVRFYGFWFSPVALVVIPVLLLVLFLTTTGLSLLASAINVKYRDIRYILPFFIQIGLFVSPIIFPAAIIFDWRRLLLFVNPMTTVVETTRALVVHTAPNLSLMLVGFLVALVTFVLGLVYFSRTESYFADIA